jgi:dTDP-4-amino-4,6-dideoxygalactose transaminase
MRSNRKIPVFLPRFRVEETLAEIRKCLERGWTGIGYRTLEIEDAWKAYTELPHAHFMNSGTAALHAAIALYKRREGWVDGDEVISTPLTFVSTNHAVLYERLTVRFADVDETACLDPADLERRIGARTRAVIFVGIGGNSGRLPQVADLCRTHGMKLILDATHMAGTKVFGRDPGHFADVSCYSFHAVKNVPTCDAGMICFRDAEMDALVRQFSWMGITQDTYARARDGNYQWKYDVNMLGYKYHGNSIAASMALVGLRYLDADNAYRRQIAAWYDEALDRSPRSRRIPIAEGCLPSRLLYQVRVDDREAALRHCHRHAIFPGVHYRDNTEYPMYAYGRNTCPNAHRLSNEVLSLPVHLELTRDDVQRVADVLLECTGVAGRGRVDAAVPVRERGPAPAAGGDGPERSTHARRDESS